MYRKLSADLAGFFVAKREISSETKSHLVKEIEKIILPSLAVEINKARIEKKLAGKTPEKRYQSFFRKGHHRKLFTNYPRLKKYLVQLTDSTLTSSKQIDNYLEINRVKIESFFNLSIDNNRKLIIPQNSDRHFQGKQTIILKTNNRELIVKYSPANSSSLWKKIVKLSNQISHLPKLKTAKTLLSSGYEIREFIEYKSAKTEREIENFYLRLGKTIACAYLLNGIDFHMDNIIARKGFPYLIDTETFLTNFESLGIKKWKNLSTTGFLKIKKSKLGDVSGISGGKVARLSLFDAYPINDKTDRIRVGFKKKSTAKPQNLPKILGKAVNPDKYQRQITEGFEKTYLHFLKRKKQFKKEILEFTSKNNISSRQIIRTTNVYAFLITSLFQPTHLKLKSPEKEIKSYLEKGYGNKQEKARKLVDYETKEILNLNIPYFYTKANKKHLYTEGKIWKNYFEKTPNQYLENKINSISKKDLKRKVEEIKEA